MTVPYFTLYTKQSDGMGRGSYTPFYPSNAEINLIQHSLSEGDRMVFTQLLDYREEEVDRKRPIKFYTSDDTKIFDGQIIDTKYVEMGNAYKILEVVANGWWQELSSMDLKLPVEYDETYTPNEIFIDLVRLANDMGVPKKAVYKYDTDRIPGYNVHTPVYTTATGTTFVFSNIYQGMQTMTRFMDVSENSSTYEFGLRIEALPRTAEDCNEDITSDDVDGNAPGIYILPFILDMDKDVASTYNKFKLVAGYNVKRDYNRLANDVIAIGDNVSTQQIGTIEILDRTKIETNSNWFGCNHAPLASHYLRVTIENPTVSDCYGWIKIVTIDEMYTIEEVFPVYIPVDGTQIFYTSNRTMDGIRHQNSIREFGLDTPPSSPELGDRYIVGTSPTDAWVGYADYFAEWGGSVWGFTAPTSANNFASEVYLDVDEYQVVNGYQYTIPGGPWVYQSGFVGDSILADSLTGCYITIHELTNDNSPYHTTIAGASINDYGLHSYRIDEMWLNTQALVDYAAGKHCRLYHAPTHVFDGEVLQRYIEYINLIGCTVDIYSSYTESIDTFLVTDTSYSFEGTKIEQRLSGMKYEYDWEYDDIYTYVVDSLYNQVVISTSEKVVI